MQDTNPVELNEEGKKAPSIMQIKLWGVSRLPSIATIVPPFVGPDVGCALDMVAAIYVKRRLVLL